MLSRDQGFVEAVVLVPGHGAIDVVGGALVPASGHVDAIAVDGFGVDDGADGVVEGEVVGAGEPGDLFGQRG